MVSTTTLDDVIKPNRSLTASDVVFQQWWLAANRNSFITYDIMRGVTIQISHDRFVPTLHILVLVDIGISDIGKSQYQTSLLIIYN